MWREREYRRGGLLGGRSARVGEAVPALRSGCRIRALDDTESTMSGVRVSVERDYGETWGVWIVTDRITLAVGIIAVYFGFRVTNFWIGLAFLAAMVVPLIWSMPRRHSLAIALVYLGRRTWPNPDDTLPVLPPEIERRS